MDKIRVGMVRCDPHAQYFGVLYQPHDVEALLDHWAVLPYYLHRFGHRRPTTETTRFGMVQGLEMTKVWDADRDVAEEMKRVFLGKPRVCDSLEEASDDVDLVFISDCYLDGDDHLALAEPGLKKGVPTFVDKPFASTLADARKMVNLAIENDTAVLSSSMLRQVPYVKLFRNRFAEIEPVGMGVVKGVGLGQLGAVIHGLSLAQHIFGEGVKWVECMGTDPLEFLHLHYDSDDPRLKRGIEVLVISSHISGPECGFRCEAYSHRGVIHSNWVDDNLFPEGGLVIFYKLREMVRTRRPQIPYGSMLELMEIFDAGRLSQERGKPVNLEEVRETCPVPLSIQQPVGKD